ncbi:SIR2 family protein [Flagellimonas aurea]|uniref:SIR2 family protein n=1 Tax=Flagellimonas aurea TaxID=2915619 RepID=UPI0035CF8CE1
MRNTIQLLNELRIKLENREMSVLIGSGFSKNVDMQLFPSWGGLLYDMIYQLYQNEIDTAWQRYSKSNGPTASSKESFYDNQIKYYSESIGYLKIVTKYIERKGIRESITAYIEERIPRISKEKGRLYLNLNNGDRKELTQEMLSQHRTLVNLPWNNIYTTNYDELLEISVDNLIKAELEKRISNLEKELVEYQKEEQSLIAKVNEVDQEIFPSISIRDIDVNTPQSSSMVTGELDQDKKKSDTELLERQRILGSIRRKIKDSEEDLNTLKEGLARCLTIVKDSSELSLKRNKNIIKLHGSLRNSNSSKFGFDNDSSKHYVISSGDYKTYPKRHEAFTQLMRISLLQESYCLIGFSGVDPNFTSWIGWVRDILERDESKASKSYKIYMIDMGLNDLSSDMLIFYKNHRIARLALMEDNTISFLEQELQTKILDRKNRKSVMNLFLKYLALSSDVVGPSSIIEILNQRDYRNAWSHLNFSKVEDVIISNLLKDTSKIVKLKSANRIPNLSFGYYNVKKRLLVFSRLLLENKSLSKRDSSKLLTVIRIAVMDMFTPINQIWSEDDFEYIMGKVSCQNKSIQRGFSILNLRAAILQVDKTKASKVINDFGIEDSNNSDDIFCEKIFLAAFSLDFEELKKLLDLWDPRGKWLLMKAGFLSFWDLDKSIDIVIKYSDSQLLGNNQEYLYSLELLDFLKRNKSLSSYLTPERKRIQVLENEGLKSSLENLDILLEDLKGKEKKITPYNEGRFSISNAVSFSNELTNAHKGMQFIQILMETGFPLVSRTFSLKDSKKWYQVFQSVFQDMPFPCLFYSLQYSDEKVLRRIGQDYAFSLELSDEKSKLLTTLLKAYVQNATPKRFKAGILIVASELLNAVEIEEWEKLFLTVLDKLFLEEKLLNEYNWTERKFAAKGLAYVRELDSIRSVLLQLLKSVDKSSSNQVIEVLYYFRDNKTLKKAGKKTQTDDLEQCINEIISRFHSEEYLVFVIGNIYELMREQQIEQVLNSLKFIDFGKLQNPRVFKVLTYIARNNPQILEKIKQGILLNKNLWANGIKYVDDIDAKRKRRSISSRSDFIELSKLSGSRNQRYGLEWTKEEAKLIYNFLVKSLREIQDVGDRGTDIINFGLLSEEMLQFLLNEHESLSSMRTYRSVLKEVKLLYSIYSGYSNRFVGLTEKNNQTVVWALRDIFGNYYNGHKDIEEDELNLILSKLLLESDPAIEACLAYVVSWLKDIKSKEKIIRHELKLISILNYYYSSKLIGYDKAFVQQQLVEIAWLMSKVGLKNPIIEKCLQIQETTSFNNIKQLELS